jgi:hypothetical protein
MAFQDRLGAARIDFLETVIVVRPQRLAPILGNEILAICCPSRRGTWLVAYVLLESPGDIHQLSLR